MKSNMQMFIVLLTLLVFAAGIHARILPGYAPIMDSSSSDCQNLNKLALNSVAEVVCKWISRVTNYSADNIILCDKVIIVISSAGLGKTPAKAPPPPKPAPGTRPVVAYI